MLGVIFGERRRAGRLDLEAVEMALRSALHQAGASALTRLLELPSPDPEQRTLPCSCGHQARYHEQRSKTLLTALGPATVSRPYYLCLHCHQGQFPADIELDIEHTEFSPGVRRMQALVGQQAPFDHGREQMKLLAGLEVTTKSVERAAESIGQDIVLCEQQEIQRAVQLDLPMIVGEPVPILYVQMDGTGVPVVRKETVGRKGKRDGQPAHTREAKLGCVFTQASWDKEGAILNPPRTPEPSKPLRSLADGSMSRAGNAAGAERKPRSSSGMVPSGSGISPPSTFPAPFRSSIFITLVNTFGTWLESYTPPTKNAATPGSVCTKNAGSTKARSRNWWPRYAPFKPPTQTWPRSFARKQITLQPTPTACGTPSSASNTCSLAPASSKPAARLSLANASNNPECSGLCVPPTPSSLSAVDISTAPSKTTGKADEPLDHHFHVAHLLGAGRRCGRNSARISLRNRRDRGRCEELGLQDWGRSENSHLQAEDLYW